MALHCSPGASATPLHLLLLATTAIAGDNAGDDDDGDGRTKGLLQSESWLRFLVEYFDRVGEHAERGAGGPGAAARDGERAEVVALAARRQDVVRAPLPG